jgi:hypothetical protein
MEEAIVNIPVQDLQADEIWSVVFCKEKARKQLSLPADYYGSQYWVMGLDVALTDF